MKVAGSLCVLSLLCLSCDRQPQSAKGILLTIASAPEGCGDGRDIVVSALGNDLARLNEQKTTVTELGAKVRGLLRTRADKVVYVKADGDIAFAEFMNVVDAIRPEAETISVITVQVDALARQRMCLEPR